MNISTSLDNTCIYCSSSGPFSAEHVIPAGMGGDYKRFMLQDIVCTNCNTSIFSPLEAAFLRSSPVAIGRLFMQGQGRNRGKKTTPPTLDAKTKVLVSEDGFPYEIELGQNGKPSVLPQLIIVGESAVKSTATTRVELLEFIEVSRTQLNDSVTCIRKIHDEVPPIFELTHFIWREGAYVRSQEVEHLAKAPSGGIWHEQMENYKSEQRLSRSRLFRSVRNKIVLRVTDDLALEKALTLYRKCLEQTDFSSMEAEAQTVENPLVSVGMSVRTDVTDRVLAKIGINILAHVAGAAYVRQSGFNETKKSILSGEPDLHSVGMEEHDEMRKILSRLPSGHHLFMIFGVPHPTEGNILALMVRLYDSQITTIKLGVNLVEAPVLLPIVFIVNYTTHSITHLGLIEFAKLLGPFGNSKAR